MVIVLVIALPFMFVNAATAVHSFRLQAAPVDPYDPFYGYYATLHYEISRLPVHLFEGDVSDLRDGQTVYVKLKRVHSDLYDAESIHEHQPVVRSSERFLKARVDGLEKPWLRLLFGLERLYGSQAEVKAWEERLRDIHATDPNLSNIPVTVVIQESTWGRWFPWARHRVDRLQCASYSTNRYLKQVRWKEARMMFVEQ